jgi:lipopolysaccharide transport system ATP-binding protein
VSALLLATDLTKVYPKVVKPADRIKVMARLLLGRALPESLAHTVLQDVSLSVAPGESLGVIGENGAGKSTLLKLLTGVIHPTRGSVVVNGQIGALLELGAGFHPDYTGRENLELAGTLYGFSGGELKSKLQEIIAFADIGHYLDEPVKHYSSGMVVRLGFALLAARRPELLITDEVLAVGDESFQKKCVRWIEDYLKGGGTLLLVSHSMYHVQKLCRQAIWLHKGRVAASGEVFDVTQRYLAHHEKKSAADALTTGRANSHLSYRVTQVLFNGDPAEAGFFLPQQASLELDIALFSPDGRAPIVLVGIVRADGTPVYGVTTDVDKIVPARMDDEAFHIVLLYPELPLLPGAYALRVHALDPEGVRLFDTVTRDFTVRGESREFGMVRIAHQWRATQSPCPQAETPEAKPESTQLP